MPNDSSQNQEEPSPTTQPVFGTPTQFSPNVAEPLGSKKPKKSKKTLFAILSAVGVFVLVAGGTITYLLLNNGTSEPVVDANTTALPNLGNALKTSLEDPANASVLVYKSSNPATVIQKIAGNVWISADDDSSVLSFNSGRDNQAGNESDYNRVIERLTTEGLTEVKTLGDVSAGYDATKATARYFSSDKLTCVLRNTPENGAYALQVDCAAQTDFGKNNTAVKPFAEVYVSNKDVLFGKPDIQNSVTKDYKTARLTEYGLGYFGDNSSAVFYQTPDGKWNFFTTAKDQDKISCDDYDSTDVVNAYLGFTCWDASGSSSSFVQNDDPTFEVVPGASGG